MGDLRASGFTENASPARSRRIVSSLLLAILLAATAVRIWKTPREASELFVAPDSEEYAIGAQRLATLGRYDIEIDRIAYPPRYSPWFSAFVLVPAYWIAPQEPGSGIVPVFLIALSGIWAAFRIGNRLSGVLGGLASAAVLACSVTYGRTAREILSDVPATALALWACDLFLARDATAERRRSAWLPGLVVALAASFRVESAALLLPFLIQNFAGREGRYRRLASLVLPSVVLVTATAAYQQAAFGDFGRNGYMFWCPLPCDYPWLSFSTRFLARNLRILGSRELLLPEVLGAIGTAWFLARGPRIARRCVLFAALAALPGSLMHLVFFFPHTRFHLNFVAFACVIGASGALSAISGAWQRRAWIAQPAKLAFALMPVAIPPLFHRTSIRRVSAETLAARTPDDAVIVSAIDPVYLEPFLLRGTHRRIVPVSRGVEYASKVVAWKRIEPPETVDMDGPVHRPPWLLAGGAVDVCPFTSDEHPERLADWVREGVPVFLDRSHLTPAACPTGRYADAGLGLEDEVGVPGLQRFVLVRRSGD